MVKSKFFSALAVLVGTTIGAGFLGIPYVVAKTGFFIGLAIMIFVAALMMSVKFYLGEISLRTKGNHQLTGYAEKYLGKGGKSLMFFAMIFGIYSALVAYLIAEGQSLSYIFLGNASFSLVFSIGFWLVLAGLTFIGLTALKKYEKIFVILVLTLVALILIIFFRNINGVNLIYVNFNNAFLPFGLVLFSFLAFSAMPEVERVLLGQEKLMKKVIFWGMFIPLIVYVLFTFVMLGNFGNKVPEIATLALGRVFSLLAVLTMFTAFFSQSLAIRDMFRFDFGLGRFKGWLLACFVPLILFFIVYYLKFASFVQILSVAGIISGGLTGVLIMLMVKKAKKYGNRKPEYKMKINWPIIIGFSLLFIFAVVMEFLR